MSYSTHTSTTVNVTNFGAQGNRIVDDTAAIQTAINSLYPRGGGTVFFPKGNYLTSGYLTVTGNNIRLQGEKGLSVINTAPSGDYRKISVSGANRFAMDSLNIDAGRTSGLNNQYTGTVQLYSASEFSITNCRVAHSEGLLVYIRGNSSVGLIQHNTFDDFHIALYADSNDISGQAYNRISVLDNAITASWASQQVLNVDENFFGAIKFQNVGYENNGTVPGTSYGHIIRGNTITGAGQMGIEFFGYLSDSVIDGNYVDRVLFGTSIAASSFDIVVSNNVYKACAYYGIELADAQNIVASNNIIEGSTGNYYRQDAGHASYAPTSGFCWTDVGIIANGVNRRPNFYRIIGNQISDCRTYGVQAYLSDKVDIVGNTLVNRAQNPGQSLNITASSNVLFSNNDVQQISTGSYFVFLDANSQPSSGLYITNNTFGGAINNWGIYYYNNGNPVSNNTNVLIEGNRTDQVTYCQFGMVDAFDNPPVRALHRNNFGPPPGSGYSITDGQTPNGTVPYQTTSIANGYQYYANTTWNVPGGGITGTTGMWLCVWSGGGGLVNEARVRVQNSTAFNGTAGCYEIMASFVPYVAGAITHALEVNPAGTYLQPSLGEVRTVGHDSSAITNSVWVLVPPVSAASAGAAFNIAYSDPFNPVTAGAIYSTYQEPALKQGAARLVWDNGVNRSELLKLSYGVQYGNGASITNFSSGLMLTQGDMWFQNRISGSSSMSLIGQLNALGQVGVGTSSPDTALGMRGENAEIGMGRSAVDLNAYLRAGLNTGYEQYWANNARFDVSGWWYVASGAYGGVNNTLATRLLSSNGTFRFDISTGASPAPIWSPKLYISPAGNVGVNHTNPTTSLHISGSLGLATIATTSSANVGGVSVPATAAGFITVNITGTNFKIPYYNI